MNVRVLLVVLVVIPYANSILSLQDIGDIISFSHEVVLDVFKTWKVISPFIQGDGPEHVDIPYVNDREKKLLTKISGITRKVEKVDKLVQSIASASKFNLKQDIPSQVRLELRIDTLLELINKMNYADNIFKEYIDVGYLDNATGPRLERHTLESFATYVVSHTPNSVQGLMDQLHSMVYPDTDHGNVFLHQSVLELIAKVLETYLCTSGKEAKMSPLVIILMTTLVLVDSRGTIKPITEVDILRDTTIMVIDDLWENITVNYEWIFNAQKEYGTDTAVMLIYKSICERLDRFVPARVPDIVAENIWNYARIQVELTGIEGLYGNFRKYQLEPPHKYKTFQRAWEDFAETVLQDTDTLPSIPNALESVHYLITGNERASEPSLYGIICEEGESSMCHVQQSPHQIVYNLYNSLQMTQLKGFTMMQFSWMLLRLYKKGNFTVESRLMRERYLERMVEQASSLKDALKLADSAYWRCDPKHHVESETYVQLTRLLQGYLQNEVDLNPKESCAENCGYYQATKQYGCYKNNYCANQRNCGGDIVECQYIDSDMWVCQADPMTSKRRYEWIEYENGRLLGSKRSCYKKTKVDSWWRWVFWHCSFCFCICDDENNSDRYFSLRNVLSTTDSNKVITGLRFVKMNGIVHIQIQEGVLEHHGRINQSSIAWQPVDNFKTKDTKESTDYMRMSYYKRAIDLDDLKAPPEHVITGIKFRMVGSHLNLEIRATPFNFTSGELIEPGKKDHWLSNDNTDGSVNSPRTKLNLESPDNPLDAISPSKIDSENDQFLLFTHSDIELDAAQTTVPFLDAQIVAPQPSVPLSGVGIYHKGQKWFGGFIGLKVFTYNYGDHIEDSFSDLSGNDDVN